MSLGLNTGTRSRPRILYRSSSSLLEVITQKSIAQISDLDYVAAHLAALDEGIDLEDFRYPEQSFFAFPQPINTPHSRSRTIRINMPSAKESGVGDKVCHICNSSYTDFVCSHMIAKWRSLLCIWSRHCGREHDRCSYVRAMQSRQR